MIEFDHIAITVNSLEESINFYKKMGYELQNQFKDAEYRWATLELGTTRLEIFEPLEIELPKIEHIAYSFTEDEEAFEIARKIGYKVEKSDVFYGDLKRKSFFVKDNNGLSIQLIKKKKKVNHINKNL